MKLLVTEKKIISIIFLAVFFTVVGYIYTNPNYYLTSQTYAVTQIRPSSTNIEKTLTVIINSADFNHEIGLDSPIIIAADKTVNVIELKTSDPNLEESEKNFQTFEPKILSQLKKINTNIELLPVASKPVTVPVELNYIKIILISLLSFAVLSLLAIFSLRYIR